MQLVEVLRVSVAGIDILEQEEEAKKPASQTQLLLPVFLNLLHLVLLQSH